MVGNAVRLRPAQACHQAYTTVVYYERFLVCPSNRSSACAYSAVRPARDEPQRWMERRLLTGQSGEEQSPGRWSREIHGSLEPIIFRGWLCLLFQRGRSLTSTLSGGSFFLLSLHLFPPGQDKQEHDQQQHTESDDGYDSDERGWNR